MQRVREILRGAQIHSFNLGSDSSNVQQEWISDGRVDADQVPVHAKKAFGCVRIRLNVASAPVSQHECDAETSPWHARTRKHFQSPTGLYQNTGRMTNIVPCNFGLDCLHRGANLGWC